MQDSRQQARRGLDAERGCGRCAQRVRVRVAPRARGRRHVGERGGRGARRVADTHEVGDGALVERRGAALGEKSSTRPALVETQDPCSRALALTDSRYPHEEGEIGSWGLR